MSMKTYSGSCHCGAVRFQAELDFAEGTIKCNCTSCAKARSWLIATPSARFRLVEGKDCQAEYEWTPPGRATSTVKFHFCKTCGIRTPGRGELEARAFCIWLYPYPAFLRYAADSAGGYWARILPLASEIAS